MGGVKVADNFDNSRYRALITNEQRKVRATVGLCCNTDSGSATKVSNENSELLSRILIDNGNCGSAHNCGRCRCSNPDPDPVNTSANINSANTRYNGRRNTSNEIRTNIYRFANQNFLSNALGISNIDISDIGGTNTEIENTVRRYRRDNHRNCRNCRNYRCRKNFS